MPEPMWMVRAGENGGIIADFKNGLVAVGWAKVGDLSTVTTKDGIRERYIAAYPTQAPGKIPGDVAVLYKFRSLLRQCCKVLTYDPNTREYFVGDVTSEYFHDPARIPDYPHLHTVSWSGSVSRDSLTVASRNSLGSALTVFSVNEDVTADLTRALGAGPLRPVETTQAVEQEELGQIKEDTFAKAFELIKDKILKLSDEDMERLTAAVLRAMGYRSRVAPRGPDRGVDVFASPDGLGLEAPRIKAQVKHRPRTLMGSQEIRGFLGGLRSEDRALYVSTGGFSKDAKYEADRSNIPITLLNLDDLAALIVTHYDQFDTDGRMLLPLTRVYFPAE